MDHFEIKFLSERRRNLSEANKQIFDPSNSSSRSNSNFSLHLSLSLSIYLPFSVSLTRSHSLLSSLCLSFLSSSASPRPSSILFHIYPFLFPLLSLSLTDSLLTAPFSLPYLLLIGTYLNAYETLSFYLLLDSISNFMNWIICILLSLSFVQAWQPDSLTALVSTEHPSVCTGAMFPSS